jgi:hypothetical protein
MQAAGRMRKLAYGQTLVLFVPAELVSKIQNADTTLSTLHVLNWVMHNTVKATADGLPAWASQGSHFCTTEDHPEARLIDENLLLEGLYGGTIVECSIYNHVVSGQKKDEKRVLLLGHEPSGKASEMMVELSEGRAKKFGSDIPIKSSGLDEECERELENERELEREAERQYARYAPNAPRKWEFKELLKSEHPSEHKALGIMPLHEAMSKSFDPKLQLSQIEWQHSGIYVTQNFFETVLIKDLGSKLEDYGLYMRPVQWIVTFQSSKCCLLSEWEAENVLEILWKRPESKVRIVQMCYLREAADTKYVYKGCETCSS